jgi:hypothetical protein
MCQEDVCKILVGLCAFNRTFAARIQKRHAEGRQVSDSSVYFMTELTEAISHYFDIPMKIICVLLLVMASAPFEQGPVRLIWNPDSIESDPSLKAFHQRLTNAVASRDSNQLLPLLADRVAIGLEKTVPRAAAPKALGLDRPTYYWWRELIGAVRLGGALSNPTTYILPFHAGSGWIEIDPGWCLATGPVIHIRAKPNDAAPSILTLQHQIIKYSRQVDEWLTVYLEDGRIGYVEAGDCIGSGVYIYVVKRNGQWRITALHHGD